MDCFATPGLSDSARHPVTEMVLGSLFVSPLASDCAIIWRGIDKPRAIGTKRSVEDFMAYPPFVQTTPRREDAAGGGMLRSCVGWSRRPSHESTGRLPRQAGPSVQM